MKIAIIGAKGQLGIDCHQVLTGEHQVTGCDLPEIDLTDQTSVNGFLQLEKPEVIINCAAYTAVDRCESKLDLSWAVNAEGPRYLAQASRELGSRLIHISTDYVFDGNRPAPESYLESDQVNPLSQYGRSKLAGEKAVAEIAPDHLILRTAWLYSSNGPNFLKTMLRLAVSDPKRELKVVDDQYGSLTWSYTLAEQIRILLDTDLTGIVHTTSEGYSTWYGAAKYFFDAMSVDYTMSPCTTAEYPTPAHRPANSILENRALNSAGLSVFTSWQEHLDQFIEMHKELLLREASES